MSVFTVGHKELVSMCFVLRKSYLSHTNKVNAGAELPEYTLASNGYSHMFAFSVFIFSFKLV